MGVAENVRKEHRRQQFLQATKARTKQFDQDLEDMRKRVSARMCLFEHAQVATAKKNAEDSTLQLMLDFQKMILESGLSVEDLDI